METTLHVPASTVSLSQLAQLIREQFPATERDRLASLIQAVPSEDDAPPTKDQLLNQLKEDYIALQKGTLKTRPAVEFLAELERDNLL
ncbi:hypothetical protein ACAW74_21375 [Fibrella sp. WM1]|uniref:hypothetical protein n=1 Tax=Fibrella musci TaxID=3242485 RepID=UPI0035230310